MTSTEAYDRACEKWGDGVAWETCGPYILESKTKAVEVMGEGESWEDAFNGAEDNYP